MRRMIDEAKPGNTVKTRRTLRVALGLAFALFASMSVAQTPPTVKPGVLTVGSDLTYPPYAYFKDKIPTGFDPDFSRLIARNMGLKTQILDTRFADLILGLKANRFDIIASALYVTPERAKLISYVPYLKTGTSIIELFGSKRAPQTPDQLCGMKISSIKGASWTPKLAKVSETVCRKQGKGPIQVMEFPTSPEALLALKSKAADAMMEDAAVAHEMLANMKDEIKITSRTLLYPIVIGLGVNKQKPKLLAALNNALAKAKKSGDYQALLTKYGLDAPTSAEVQASLHEKN